MWRAEQKELLVCVEWTNGIVDYRYIFMISTIRWGDLMFVQQFVDQSISKIENYRFIVYYLVPSTKVRIRSIKSKVNEANQSLKEVHVHCTDLKDSLQFE